MIVFASENTICDGQKSEPFWRVSLKRRWKMSIVGKQLGYPFGL